MNYAYDDAVVVLAGVLRCGTGLALLVAFRATVVAQIALLRLCAEPVDLVIAEALGHELVQLDHDIADRADSQPN